MLRVAKLYRLHVYDKKEGRSGKEKLKSLGRVHMTVFAPDGKHVVGFTITQPDIAGMVKRPDLFIAYDAFEVGERGLVATKGKESFDDAARKRLGLDWDSCIIWCGMDAKTTDGKELGYIDDVAFDPATGEAQTFYVGDGGLSQKLVGTVEIPVSMLRGYKKGFMLVDPAAAELALNGGLAAKAGEDFAKAKVASKEGAAKAGKAATEAVDKGSHELGRAISRTAKAMEESKEEFEKASGTPKKKPSAKKGASGQEAARAVGKQLGKMGSMFGSFMDEYKKASK